MITRFRVEVEAENKESAEQELDEGATYMTDNLEASQPGDTWTRTDHVVIPATDSDGNAVIYGRSVYKREGD